MPPEQDSPLESLEKRLYRAPEQPKVEVPQYSAAEAPHPYGWQAPPPPPPQKKRMPWTLLFLIGAGVFLVIAGLVAAFLIFQGTRAISSDRVEITVPPSTGIASGDTISLVVTIRNDNPTPLVDATFNASLPQGTRAGASDEPLPQYNDVLGTVPAGGEVTRTIQAKLFGREGETLTIPMKVEYHTAGSNALFVAEKNYTVTISSSPISVQVQALSQTPTGQPFTISVIVRSNASAPVENVGLAAAYPSGFSAQSATPAATGSNFFSLGRLEPGEQKTVQIRGVLIGENTDQRVFRFTAGSINPDGTNTLVNSFAEGIASIAITHPFLTVGLSLDNQSADPVIVLPGQSVNALLSWKNTLPSTLSNSSIRTVLSGNALNAATINGGTGFYRSTDSSVIFDSSTNAPLASLAAGDSGAGSFSFSVKDASALAGVQNPTVTLTVSVTGQQASQGGAAQALNSTLTRTVRVGTTVALTSSVAMIAGPIPPTAGTETTYTVTLAAKNSVNSVGAAKETFTLPGYVRYIGQGDPNISFNPDTRTVTWRIGDIAGGASATAKFQIGFTPSTSQNGTSPFLINEQTFSGFDRFTQQQVSATGAALTSELQGVVGSGTVH